MPRRPIPILALVFAAAALAATATGHSLANDIRGLAGSPREAALLADVADGSLDEFGLLEAAIVAGGVDDAQQLDELLALWRRHLSAYPFAHPQWPTQERARQSFRILHEALCRGDYRADASDVAQVLGGGEYNCLSATVLYLALVRRQGLRAVAVAREGHVLARVVGESPLDVETTCPDWFERQEKRRALGTHDRAASDKPQNTSLRPLSDVQLLAKTYYNRGVESLRQREFAEGLRLTRLSVLLDAEDTVAGGNLLAGLNNWALALCAEARYAEAADRLAELRRLDPAYGPLAENDVYVRDCWAKHVQSQAEFDDAVSQRRK